MDADLDTIYAAWNGRADLLWQVSGSTLTPVDTTKAVALATGPTNPLLWGARTIKGRLVASSTGDALYLTGNAAMNAGSTAWVQDDVAKPSWIVTADSTTDQAILGRLAAGGTYTAPLAVKGSDGKTYCTLADASVTLPMLAPGVAVRTPVSAAFPTGYGWSTLSTWAAVVSVNITTRGGWVMVFNTPALSMSPATSLSRIFLVITRGATKAAGTGTDVAVCSIPLQAPAGTMMPLPTICCWDHPPAGAQVYYYNININAGSVGSAADTPGNFIAAELA
jgi:hypothetical protein